MADVRSVELDVLEPGDDLDLTAEDSFSARESLPGGTGWRARRRAYLAHDGATLALLVAATLGFFWRVATGQNWTPADGGDLVSFLYPTYRFAAAALHAGTWPLWNPYLYAGAPHIGDIQAGFLYPPNLILFLLRPDFPYSALQWLSMGHIWFAGAGMYLFLARGHGLKRAAALAGALAFMFSDAFLVHFGNLNFNAVASWTPWVFWAYTSGLDALQGHRERTNPILTHRFGYGALAGFLLAVATLAGHIQATLFILLAMALYTGSWLWMRREEPGPAGRALNAAGLGVVAVLTNVLVAAPVLLPALQLSRYTMRATWNYQEAAGYSLSPAQWIGWLIPGFFGRGPQYHWGAWPRVEAGYLGILPLFLVALALTLRRERRTWTWLGLAAITFVIALGAYAIPHGWLTLLPGFGQLRAPARLVFVTDFALAALAAIGLDAALGPLSAAGRAGIESIWRLAGRATAAVAAIAVPLAYLALLLAQGQDQAIILRLSITLIAIMLFAGLLGASLFWLAALRGEWAKTATLAAAAVVLIMLDLASTGAYQDVGNDDPSQSFQHPEIAAFLSRTPEPFRIDTRTGVDGVWQPDTALFYGLEDVGGVANPLLMADVQRYWEGLSSRSSRLYDLLNARYVIARKDVVLDWQKFALVFDGDSELNVYENKQVLPRAFVASTVQIAPGHEEAWAAIHAPDFDPSTTAVIETTSDMMPGSGRGAAAHGEVSVIENRPGRLSLRATLAAPGVVVISQVWYPGWQVRIDGAPAGQPLRTDYTFQGIPLDAGTHEIVLVFDPAVWRLGWGLAIGAIIVLFAWTATVIRARSRAGQRRAAGRLDSERNV